MRTRHARRRRRADALGLFLLLALGLGCLVVAGGFLAAQFSQAETTLGAAADDLNPFERVAFGLYLAARADDLNAPAGPDPTPRNFSVAIGESAAAVAERLAAAGLVSDGQLLSVYLRYTGADGRIEAGDFVLRETMAIPDVARALTDAQAREVAVRLPEGWRREELAEALAANPNLAVSADDWLRLTGPDVRAAGPYAFYADLPPGASLEGFILPDTYLLRPGASAADVLARALANFDARITADYRTRVSAHGLSLYQAVIIAALIEREAAVDDERPVIASVILNRLAAGQPLEIDATVQYALGTAGAWWPPVRGLDFRAIANPFNTYYVTGLPAGPITNPGLESLLAVANASQTGFYFYRALCDGSGRHAFAVTYEEHLANACP
jgi:UPF0755 protein